MKPKTDDSMQRSKEALFIHNFKLFIFVFHSCASFQCEQTAQTGNSKPRIESPYVELQLANSNEPYYDGAL